MGARPGLAYQLPTTNRKHDLPVRPTFFLHSRHLFFFFFPESFCPESSAEAPGEPTMASAEAAVASALAPSKPEEELLFSPETSDCNRGDLLG